MSHLHHNSQKRIFRQGARYFITSVTFDRYPYFKNPILAELFVRDLWIAKELEGFELFGYTVMPDHVHLMFEPKVVANYSDIIGTLKRNVARDANDMRLDRQFIRNLTAGDDSNHRLRANFDKTKINHPSLTFERYSRHFDALQRLKSRFLEGSNPKPTIPTFHWQKSFRDHLIRGQQDFNNHLQCIFTNAVKHGMASTPEQYPFVWIQGMPIPTAHD